MKASRVRRDHRADAIALGTPTLAVADADRELLEDLVAELLVKALERTAEERAS
jgi:hypothetical protein